MNYVQILQNANYFSSIPEISIFISSIDTYNRRNKYIINHIISTHIPPLIKTQNDIEEAIMISSVLYNGVYVLVNSVCDEEQRNSIIKYINQDMNCDSLYIALKHNIITTDIFDAILSIQFENKLIDVNVLVNNYLMLSQYINTIVPYIGIRILSSAIKFFNVMKNIITLDKFYLVMMAKSIYKIINNIDYDLYRERFDIATSNIDIKDFYVLLNTEEYENLVKVFS